MATLRRLIRWHASARVALYTLALLAVFATAVPLIALEAAPRHGGAVLLLGELALGGVLVWLVAKGLWVPFKRSRQARDVARWVGTRRPELASDLLSAVQFMDAGADRSPDGADGESGGAAGARRPPAGSPDLVSAFLAQVSRRLDGVEPKHLLSGRELRRAGFASMASLCCLALALAVASPSLYRGWQRVLDPRDTRPFGGASMAGAPLVEDVRITVDYPAYSERPPLVLPSASGDVRAMPGSTISLETRTLEPVRGAWLLLESETTPPTDPEEEATGGGNMDFPFQVTGDRSLSVGFTVTGTTRYRILTEGLDGKRRVESSLRRVEIDGDEPPEVELYAPGDEIDVASLKRIELAYIAEDDYGIARVDLVWHSEGERHAKSLALEDPMGRTAQGKLLWDLADLSLEPGAEVSYHIEVADNDDVGGPNIGHSQEFKLRVFSPREKHEALVDRQRVLLERLLRALAGRLLATGDLRSQLALQRENADLVVELGTLVAGLREDEFADDSLRTTLDEIRARLDGLVKAEAELLVRMDNPQERGARPSTGASGAATERGERPASPRIAASNVGFVAELEDDALLLSNWIERQQMENLLAITDDVAVHQDRLRQLFKEYRRTQAPELVAEIERELRSLEQRLSDVTEQRGQLADDVLDRFVHSDAIQEERATDCMDEVRALMREGAMARAEELLEQCMGTIDDATQAMEEALGDLRGETFSEEERRFAEAIDRLLDLAYEQDEIASAAQEIWDRYAARADEMMREEAKETRRRVSRLLERLHRQIDKIPKSGMTPFAREEMDIVGARLNDVDRMLADGDIAEAMAMAEQARGSVETAAADMDAAIQEEGDEPWGESTAQARRDLGRVEAAVEELVRELSASTPSPREIMGRADQRELERLARRQASVAERGRRLADKTRKGAGDLPGRSGEALADGVDAARSHMDRSQQRMRSRDPSGARQESRSAAEIMERTVQATRDAARGRRSAGRAGLRDEPIRIPGASEYKAPAKFREDILEAMKRENAPRGFGAQVKRYYEELIR